MNPGFALCAALLSLFALPPNRGSAGSSFPQLLSTKYEPSSTLPSEAHQPETDLSFVHRAALPAGSHILSAARAFSGVVWVVTDAGTYRQQGDTTNTLAVPAISRANQLSIPVGTKVRSVCSDTLGHIWAATSCGVFITDGADWWERLDRKDGMPYDDVTCVHLAANGDVWGGTPEGAWRLRSGKFRYFWGKRWLPGNRVSAIWSDSHARVWFDTDGGIGSIEEQQMSLLQKAVHFDSITQLRHNRRGYIGMIHLKTIGDPTGGANFEAADSDGIWTALYVSAMCFRYAATHAPQARAQAQQSMRALLELERLSGIPGYPARSVATDQEIKDGIRGYNPDQLVHVVGERDKYWVRSPVETDVWLKTDTSSDTMDGHFFVWYLYHELVADASEKKKIEGVVRRAVDSMISHDYTLIGHSGRKTRWGVWGPQFLNDDPEWADQRGINSLEILSHLKVAYHLTGDKKYEQAYNDLIEKHHYLQNTLLIRRGNLVNWWELNHSDDQLVTIAFYPLLQLEKDPARRRILLQSLARTWEDSVNGEQTQRAEHSSLYNFAYGALSGNACDAAIGVTDLQDWPWDMVDWTVNNSRRHDVKTLHHTDSDYEHNSHLDHVLPASERSLRRWSGNPWQGDGGNDGRIEYDGGAWLFAYWMGVYHGYILRER